MRPTSTLSELPRAWADLQTQDTVLVNDGSEPVGNTPDEFAAIIKAETAKWTKVIKSAGIKAE